mgnify:CR=1 FL=1|jgi:hypothetical protein
MAIATFETLLSPSSIRIEHVNFDTNDLSGDYIDGGTITHFSSTGIKDDATNLVLHIDDNGLSVESLTSNDIEVTNITVSGTMTVENLKYNFTQEEIVDSIHLGKQGLIHMGHDTVLSRSELGSGVAYSNLRTVGHLEKLIVIGNLDAGYSLHVNSLSNRVGINTSEPVAALHIQNDSGAELVVDGVGDKSYIGTARNTDLVFGTNMLGSEKAVHMTVCTNGNVGIGTREPTATLEVHGDIKFDGVAMSSGYATPKPGWHNKSEIIWNQEPAIGQPIGWVCIESGDPGSWALFGLIE